MLQLLSRRQDDLYDAAHSFVRLVEGQKVGGASPTAHLFLYPLVDPVELYVDSGLGPTNKVAKQRLKRRVNDMTGRKGRKEVRRIPTSRRGVKSRRERGMKYVLCFLTVSALYKCHRFQK